MLFAESTNQDKQEFKYNGKELDQMYGLNQYDYSARYYDPGYSRFTTQDPHNENYYSWSPYVYCFNNPMRFIDPDGKDGRDKVLGFIAAVSDNLTLGFTQVRDRGAAIASNYNSGQDLGDLSSIIVGTAMVDGGAAALGGSVVVTAGTGGLSSEITIPTALAGLSTIFQGASLLTQ